MGLRAFPNMAEGNPEQAGKDSGSWEPGCSQLGCGLRGALGDLGQLQAGTLHYASLAAALVGTDNITAALTVELIILGACRRHRG